MGKQWKQWLTLFFGGSKITADGNCSHEIKRHLLLGRKVMTNLDSVFKSRDITLSTKVCLVKAMVFPVVMCGCESWTLRKLSAEELMLLNCGVEKTLESRLNCRRSNHSILKEISLECSLEGLMLKLKLQSFGHLMRRADSFAKTLMLGKIEGGRRRGRRRMRRMDGITDSMDIVWVNSGSWWWTGRLGVLRFMGSQSRTRLSNWTEQVVSWLLLPWLATVPNLPCGTQGRPQRLESCLQEMGDKRASMPESHTGPHSASLTAVACWQTRDTIFILTNRSVVLEERNHEH